ncbi:pantoate--beta-alanine ligase [Planctomyces sp. SH-PL14]|uniref:pantoate--beta-alanine ligase n=1 Tax=Planctomyces sp. SH-PL14 TaxID=1632864 RepID=UPI00078DEBFB|nr:pantoate--beta-alanine ligase [Planctomyces sp. SH-PL14]AMV17776.1 Pantothenate synthetase [Planctomyces sp. SH-PL14]
MHPDGFTVTNDLGELRRLVAAAREQGRKIGCVPTMGALHPGHMSLVEESKKRAGFHVLTIFVNPTQFAPTEDLAKYPRPIEKDLQMCRQAGVNVVYMPEITALYPEGYDTWVTVDVMSKVLEGEFRPTHFRGVTTIVLKLFNIVQPDVACFGAKDYQQQTIIRKMVRDLNVPVDVVVCPTIREPDGLAMSSRNVYLGETDRQTALCLSQALELARRRITVDGDSDIAAVQAAMRQRLDAQPGVQVDYAVIADADTLEILTAPRRKMVALIAARVGATRLIDNLVISG